ncbi:MAG: glycoside hydrolase family 127 protein [Trueperaceae bacterium]|nr:glycoside hydrolase family 127 protein [Trueperaceae bacterium]
MDYPIKPVDFTRVTFNDTFWQKRLQTNQENTLSANFKKCEETGRIDNFAKAAGQMKGPHEGIYFNDSDVYKVMEGAAYSLSVNPDPELDAYMDKLIALVGAAQEKDGYLYTPRTINPDAMVAEREGLSRWSNLKNNHELYMVGHMYEAAVAHYQATGKRNFLEIALKSADLIDSVFGPNKIRDIPGHQEIEIGLVKLYRVTGEARYLNLAKFFLDERGHYHNREAYNLFDIVGYSQDHLPVTEQTEVVGHAVRAVYMYAGMADIAALTGNKAYIGALDKLWHDLVDKKMYITGGIGSSHHGESFGKAYDLPNAEAYNETCAAIADIFWNHRMFLLHGDSKYQDVLERTLYNGFLVGVSLSGDTFFYANPLASDGKWKFNVNVAATRSPWFDCSCCPTNVVRLMPSLPGYIYAHTDDKLYVNHYVAGSAKLDLSKTKLDIIQETNYPWEGKIKLTLNPEQAGTFTLALRIPGWARNEPLPGGLYHYANSSDETISLKLNGEAQTLKLDKGYALVSHTWQRGDIIELNIPMPIRLVSSRDEVSANAGKLVIERGPVVYCAEAVDNNGQIQTIRVSKEESLSAEFDPDFLDGLMLIKGKDITLIPYYAWSHRGEGEMAVWFQTY